MPDKIYTDSANFRAVVPENDIKCGCPEITMKISPDGTINLGGELDNHIYTHADITLGSSNNPEGTSVNTDVFTASTSKRTEVVTDYTNQIPNLGAVEVPTIGTATEPLTFEDGCSYHGMGAKIVEGEFLFVPKETALSDKTRKLKVTIDEGGDAVKTGFSDGRNTSLQDLGQDDSYDINGNVPIPPDAYFNGASYGVTAGCGPCNPVGLDSATACCNFVIDNIVIDRTVDPPTATFDIIDLPRGAYNATVGDMNITNAVNDALNNTLTADQASVTATVKVDLTDELIGSINQGNSSTIKVLSNSCDAQSTNDPDLVPAIKDSCEDSGSVVVEPIDCTGTVPPKLRLNIDYVEGEGDTRPVSLDVLDSETMELYEDATITLRDVIVEYNPGVPDQYIRIGNHPDSTDALVDATWFVNNIELPPQGYGFKFESYIVIDGCAYFAEYETSDDLGPTEPLEIMAPPTSTMPLCTTTITLPTDDSVTIVNDPPAGAFIIEEDEVITVYLEAGTDGFTIATECEAEQFNDCCGDIDIPIGDCACTIIDHEEPAVTLKSVIMNGITVHGKSTDTLLKLNVLNTSLGVVDSTEKVFEAGSVNGSIQVDNLANGTYGYSLQVLSLNGVLIDPCNPVSLKAPIDANLVVNVVVPDPTDAPQPTPAPTDDPPDPIECTGCCEPNFGGGCSNNSGNCSGSDLCVDCECVSSTPDPTPAPTAITSCVGECNPRCTQGKNCVSDGQGGCICD